MVACWIRSDSLLRQQRRPKRHFAKPDSHLPLTREMLTRKSPSQRAWHKLAMQTLWRAGHCQLYLSAKTRKPGSVSLSRACTTLPVECYTRAPTCMMATAHLPTSCSWQRRPNGPLRVPSRHYLMLQRRVELERSHLGCAKSLQLLQTLCVPCSTLAFGLCHQGSRPWGNVGCFWISQYSRCQVQTALPHHLQTTRALRPPSAPLQQRSYVVVSIAIIPSTASRVASAPTRVQKRLS
mmetsp:Transcript_54981/g.128559  ORF Transcript_54981/g.128559 Transcript_54981/m.128559 type:complete len:237 (+) Transcript_54981:135-845(+)